MDGLINQPEMMLAISISALFFMIILLALWINSLHKKVQSNKEVADRAHSGVFYLENETIDDMQRTLSILHPDHFYHPSKCRSSLDEEE